MTFLNMIAAAVARWWHNERVRMAGYYRPDVDAFGEDDGND